MAWQPICGKERDWLKRAWTAARREASLKRSFQQPIAEGGRARPVIEEVDRLSEIIEVKRTRLLQSKRIVPLSLVRAHATDVRANAQPHRLAEALTDRERINIIAEIKRASPSKGLIRADINPAAQGRAYEAGGASAVSVLTEEDHFCGSLDDLRKVRHAIALPLLCKDFIFDEYQIYECAAAGADALLLITAVLDDETLKALLGIAEDELGLDALIEVHTLDEMNRANRCGARIIGVNNRDLRTFEVSLTTSANLASLASNGTVLVSESGIETWDDIQRLRTFGYRGFLIGEHLMRADNPERALRALLDGR